MKRLNMNHVVRVKLTPHGTDIYYHRFDELNKKIVSCGGKPLGNRMPEVDKDGFTKFQLWDFIEIYGEHIGMAKKNVVSDLSFYIDDKDLEEVK